MKKAVKCQKQFNKIYCHLKPEGKEQLKHLVLDVGLHHYEAMDMILTQHQDLFKASVYYALVSGKR